MTTRSVKAAEIRLKKDIGLKLRILTNLLAASKELYPPLCNCAIKSRDESHHLPKCPYRELKDVMQQISAIIEGPRPLMDRDRREG
jgi:hypothetical protein